MARTIPLTRHLLPEETREEPLLESKVLPLRQQNGVKRNADDQPVSKRISTRSRSTGRVRVPVPTKKFPGSPAKSTRRRRQRTRKQRIFTLNPAHRVDYFDKRVMEKIKHRLWLASSVDQHAVNVHDCTFHGEILARRILGHTEPQVLVRWHPRSIIPDEWLAERQYSNVKLVPFRTIPVAKLRLLYPSLFTPVRVHKSSRKRKHPSQPSPPMSPSSSSRLSTPRHSEGSSSASTVPPPSPPASISSQLNTLQQHSSSSPFSDPSCSPNSSSSEHWALQLLYEEMELDAGAGNMMLFH